MQARGGGTWNRKWRDDMTSGLVPRPRLSGVVVGFADSRGERVGENSGRDYETDRVTERSGPGRAVVEWENVKRSVYPVGAGGVFSLRAVL